MDDTIFVKRKVRLGLPYKSTGAKEGARATRASFDYFG
jgi:hypothetical protein